MALPEVVYIRDVFSGGAAYRLNTVFKFYYQGWTLLGLAGAYGAYRSIRTLRELATSWLSMLVACALGLGVLAALVYTIEAPQSAEWGGISIGLDGISGLREAAPADVSAVGWLQHHESGNPVVLEAVGHDYQAPTSDVSTFTGLPTVMGWQGHEPQWRGNDPEIQQRVDDINTVYTTHSVATARSLLKKYHVRYVFVGTNERAISGADVSKFRTFMHVAFPGGSASGEQGATIYTW